MGSRAFIDIQIENVKIPALLDSGASVSLLGKDCSELVANINAKIMPFLSNIRTAGSYSGIISRFLLAILVYFILLFYVSCLPPL